MPNPHFDITITKRSEGKSAVAGAAYISGTKLFSEYDQKNKDYSKRSDVVYTQILLPANAPPEYADRETLWNAAEEVEKIDQKIKVQTFFIKALTVDADSLLARAKSDAVKAECKKVYEAVRYSDPMSNDALASTESQITVAFAKLTAAVGADEIEAVKTAAEEVIILIGDRNRKCKLLK